MRGIVTSALLLIVIHSSGVVAAQKDAGEKSLYRRVGGYDTIAAITNDFGRRLDEDPDLHLFDIGFSSDTGKRQIQMFIEFVNAVKIQYYQALAAQEMVGMRNEISRISSETAKYSRQLLNIGQQNESEVLQAEVAAQEADLAVIAAEHARRRALTSLAVVVGNPTVREATLGGSLAGEPPRTERAAAP